LYVHSTVEEARKPSSTGIQCYSSCLIDIMSKEKTKCITCTAFVRRSITCFCIILHVSGHIYRVAVKVEED